MNNGWIKLNRQIIEWEWYKNSNVKDLFIHLLLLANHADGKWQGIPIKRGQTLTSVAHITEKTNLSRSQIRRALKHLQDTKEISVKTTKKYTLVTIENYDKYQDDPEESDHQRTISEPSMNHQATINKNKKNEKKEKKEENLIVIGKFEKPTLEEVKKYIFENNYNVDAEYFYNYYEANGWKVGKNKIVSWKSCIEIWHKRGEKENKIYKPKYNNYDQREYHNLDELYCNFMKES